MNSRISDVKIVFDYYNQWWESNVYMVTYTVRGREPIGCTSFQAKDELHAFKLFTEYVNKTHPQRENHEHSI